MLQTITENKNKAEYKRKSNFLKIEKKDIDDICTILFLFSILVLIYFLVD